MAVPYKADKDLSEAQKMVDALDEYVRGTELYGHTGGGFFGGGDSPALTIGALLLRLRRLQARQDQLSSAQSSQLSKIDETFQHVRNEWRLHYEGKLLKEANSRLDNLRTYIKEASDAPRSARGNYPTEALRRTIVQEVLREMKTLNIDSAEIDTKRREVDGKLRGLLRSAPFQWDSTLESVYPSQEFWWLYHMPEEVTTEK
jgi:hypothetical protein